MSGFMERVKGLIFGCPATGGIHAFDRAMHASGELIERFQQATQAPDPIRTVFKDMWLERHNIPYATSVFETHQEMIAPLRQKNGNAS